MKSVRRDGIHAYPFEAGTERAQPSYESHRPVRLFELRQLPSKQTPKLICWLTLSTKLWNKDSKEDQV